MKKSGRDINKRDDGLEAIVALLAVVAISGAFVWFLASHRIVFFWAQPLAWLAWPYSLWDNAHWQSLQQAAEVYRQRPRAVGLLLWMRYVNACMLPLAVMVCALTAIYALSRFVPGAGQQQWRRRLDPMATAREIAQVFPSILPVLHLGPQLMADKLPLWRRQTFPEDIWLHEKIDGRPMAASGRLDLRATETYFRGGERLDGPHQKRSGRRWSKTLGFQVVDLLEDADRQQSICFPDRFSAQGKALYALLSAYAFGGAEGKKDYDLACAQLSRTAAGQPNGLPNLTVAQWLYGKYRMNSSARALFAIHHWEYTYLFALFRLAKKNGKATHTDWIWLRPLDRILWYALNAVGRATPHAEAAAVFCMVDYESQCAKNKRLPLRVRGSDGQLEHHIHVWPVVEGQAREFERWSTATDEDEDWWRKADAWTGASALAQQRAELTSHLAAERAVHQQLAEVPMAETTPFDEEMSAAAVLAEQRSRHRERQAIFGDQAGSDARAAGGKANDGDLDFL